jgi:uncharacterized UBP type Zn finger protein
MCGNFSSTPFLPVYANELQTGAPKQLQVGNSCFLNAVLQALFHCPRIRAAVLEESDLALANNNSSSNEETAVDAALRQVFKGLQEGVSSDKITRYLQRMLRNLTADSPESLFGSNQQDAQEFLNRLLNRIAARGADGKPWVTRLVQGEMSCESRCLVCEKVIRYAWNELYKTITPLNRLAGIQSFSWICHLKCTPTVP